MDFLTALGFILPALVSSGVSIGSGIQSAKLNKKTMKWQEKMYDKQREDAIEDRDYQNAYNAALLEQEKEYNSPEAQMQRYQDAGLNPNLIYGSANGFTAQAQPAASTSSASVPGGSPYQSMMDLSPLVAFASQYSNMMNQVKSTEASVEYTNAQKDYVNAQKKKVEQETDDLKALHDYNFGGVAYQYDYDKNEWVLDEKGEKIPMYNPGMMNYNLHMMEDKIFQAFWERTQSYYDSLISELNYDIRKNDKTMSDNQVKLVKSQVDNMEYIKGKMDNVINNKHMSTTDKFMSILNILMFNTLNSGKSFFDVVR